MLVTPGVIKERLRVHDLQLNLWVALVALDQVKLNATNPIDCTITSDQRRLGVEFLLVKHVTDSRGCQLCPILVLWGSWECLRVLP